ncbi:MAG: hypothetical protein KG003_15670 [Bacteroidetes bacterium]|nr:hypothetical protein [Bacteroidota bacterium]
MTNKKLFFIPCLALLLLSSCGNSTEAGKKDSTIKETKQENYDRKFNDIARYIAALDLEKGSVVGSSDTSKYFSEHRTEFNQRWKELDEKRLSKMRDFAKNELSKKINPDLNLFYPFSGADFIHANQFFPNAKKSLYIANETVGEVPDLQAMSEKQRKEYLQQVEVALQDIFKRSYFITKRMMNDIPAVKGVIPIYMVFLARTNNEVLNVELIDLVSGGKVISRKGKATGAEGVRFTYCPAGNKSDIRTLEYFNCDASNTGMAKKPQVIQYVKAFGKSNVFFKAASYLMHWPFFSDFRDATLNIADGVVEDDTGIPFKYLKDKYTYTLYGTYTKPVKDFGKGGYQQDLADAYKEGTHVKPLPFSLGYHWWDNQQNYMCFKHK